MALTPVSFQYTPQYNGALQSDPNFNGTYVGFIAEDVAKTDPRLITVDATGTTPSAPHGVRYENITAILAGAIQDIASISGVFRDNLTQWLADASNGINNLFAKNIYADNITAHHLRGDEVCANRSDGTEVCVNGDQLAAVLAAVGQTGVAPGRGSGSVDATTSTPPTITILGNDPATIHVGDSYNDLGASAKDSAGRDLTVHTFLNGTLTEPLIIDTSSAATDTIDYVAIDGAWLTSTSTRTVVVQIATTTAQ
jgi:hypothetical protein